MDSAWRPALVSLHAPHPKRGDQNDSDASIVMPHAAQPPGAFALDQRGQRLAQQSRAFRYAAQLTFAHPVSGEQLRIEAPLPDELSLFLRGLTDTAGLT